MNNKDKLNWKDLALMCFMTVWGFGNSINGFANFNGLGAVAFWVIVLVLYFTPYSLMVGELGSTFSKEDGGVSLWVNKTMGKKLAFFAGWMYYVVHLPYISQKPSRIIIAASWMLLGKKVELSVTMMQLISLAIFFVAVFLATKGLSILKKLSSIAGLSLFIMSILYIIMTILASFMPHANTLSISLSNFKPQFTMGNIMNISILIFAVGGCEKISPYVNKLKDPKKDFPRGLIALTFMVIICAVLGTTALGMMFDSNNIPGDLMANGAYYAFQNIGEYYHLGNFLMIIYAIADLIANVAVIILSIDAPLHMLLGNNDKDNIPEWFYKQNKNGVYINGLKLTTIVVSILIILPMIGIEDINQLVTWLVKLNSICMPLRYLWVFLSYVMLKVKTGQFDNDGYVFIKNKNLGIIAGVWCLLVTAVSCLTGMYSENMFELIMNIATPIVLLAIGLLLPLINSKKKYQ